MTPTYAEESIAELIGSFKPPAAPSLSEWAEENFVLSPEYAAFPGPIALKNWQREIFNSFSDPLVQEITVMCGTQLVKTLFIQAAIAYVIDQRPGPILVIEPKESDAETFSKERLGPMIRDCEIIHKKVSPEKSRDSSNTTLYKQFKGGTLTLVGAIAPGNLARRSVQYLFCDEVDKYPPSAGKEGDPIGLARERLVSYGSRAKLIQACSPTVDGESRISRAYEESDRRKPWVECPHCGAWQVLKWGQVRWDNSLPEEQRPATARYFCEACEHPWTESQRRAAADRAHFRAEKPFAGRAGFWISHLYSPWERKSLYSMVADFLAAHRSPRELQVFVNSALAELWKIKGEAPDWKRIYDRREEYAIGVAPLRGLLLTAAVDVQFDRLEFEVKAWGPNRENWSIYYEVIQPPRVDTSGNLVRDRAGHPILCTPADPEPWDRLAELIARDWPTAGGAKLPIMACAVDTGYSADKVYYFCRRYPQPAHGPAGSRVHSFRTVVPVKGGHSSFKLLESVSDTDAARKRGGLKIVTIGTPHAKEEFYAALRLESPIEGASFPPSFCHYPHYEVSYFQGLCAETRLINSRGSVEWRKDGRNEPLDLQIYNRAAAALCGMESWSEEDWKALAEHLNVSRPQVEQMRKPAAADPEPAEGWIPRRQWFK